jgi:hypothetical protein
MTVKYRRLTFEELRELEKEFVDYLVVNGITAEEWVTIKQKENTKAEQIIDLFSDVVFEGVMRKARFADHVSASSLMCFQFNEQEIVLTALEDTSGLLDFTQDDTFDRLKSQVPKGVKVYQQTKPYQKRREDEIFNLVQNGAQLSDGRLFKHLSLLYAASHSF